jgi:hypothetical protein
MQPVVLFGLSRRFNVLPRGRSRLQAAGSL